MLICLVETACITVHDYKDLREAYRLHRESGLVGRYVCRTPLTESQKCRLPPGLRAKMQKT
jgi:hypothetical protein